MVDSKKVSYAFYSLNKIAEKQLLPNKLFVKLNLKMIRKFLNWLNSPKSKTVKTTYGDGFVSYQGFIKHGFLSTWSLASDHSNFSKDRFESLSEVQKMLAFKIKQLNKSRIIKKEIV